MGLNNLVNGWHEINLKDCILTIESGKRPKGGAVSDGIPSLGGEHIDSNGGFKIKNEKLKYVPKDFYEKMKSGIIQTKDILIVKDGATTGKIAYVDEKFPLNEAGINEHLFLLRTDGRIYSKYLAYYLRSQLGQENIMNDFRGATVGGISKEFINFKMLVPSIETQKKIVKVLEKAEKALEKRKESKRLLDELVKSQFIELFGEKKFPIAKAEEVCEYITKGTTPKSNDIINEFEEDLVPYLKVYNLSFDGSMLFEDKPQYVTLETHNKFLARSKVYPNDVLMNIVGPPLGKFAIVPNTFSEWNINQAIAIFRATNKINPLYLLHSLKQPRVLKPFIDSAVGVRQQNLSLLQCRNLEIQLPPIELQNQFANFVNQVDKLKFEMQKSLEEMESNFNSLMHRAFK